MCQTKKYFISLLLCLSMTRRASTAEVDPYKVPRSIDEALEKPIWKYRLIHRSVFVNGERIDLKDVLFTAEPTVETKKTEKNEENEQPSSTSSADASSTHTEISDKTRRNQRKSVVMFAAVKCEIADSIYQFFGAIHRWIRKSLDNQNDEQKSQQDLLRFLNDLNEQIESAITTLNLFTNLSWNLKASEPFFIKTLIMISFYIRKLNFIKKNFEYYERNELIYLNAAESLFDFEYVDHKSQKEVRETLEKELLKLDSVSYVILQIKNLIERFMNENCCCTAIDRKNGRRTLKFYLKNLGNLLTGLGVARQNDNSYKRYNLDDVLVAMCFDIDVKKTFRGCVEMRDTVRVRETVLRENGDKKKFVKIQDVYREVAQTFDMGTVDKYLKLIFDVIMKLVFKKSLEYCDDKEKETITKDLKRVKALRYPVHLTNYLTVLNQASRSYNDGYIDEDTIDSLAKDFLQEDFDSLADINVEKKKDAMSLKEFVQFIFEFVGFQQFWWVFNLLQNELERKSDRVYGVSFVWHPTELVDQDVKRNNAEKCDSLVAIYRNYFEIERELNECVRNDDDDVKQCFSLIRQRRAEFLNHLLRTMVLWDKNEHLKNDEDLRKIVIAAIVQLQNEFHTTLDVAETDTATRKVEMLRRLGNEITILLDNYRLRNCWNTENRRRLYGAFRSERRADNRDISFIVPINFPGTNAADARSTDAYEIDNYMQTLTHYRLVVQDKRFAVFADSLYFNWYGSVKTFSEILRVDVMQYTSGFYRVVDYQRLFFKWLWATFYTAWLIVLEAAVQFKGWDVDDREEYNNAFFVALFEFIDTCIPASYQSYRDTAVRLFCLFIEIDGTKIKPHFRINELKSAQMDPMKEIFNVVHIEPIGIRSVLDGFDVPYTERDFSMEHYDDLNEVRKKDKEDYNQKLENVREYAHVKPSKNTNGNRQNETPNGERGNKCPNPVANVLRMLKNIYLKILGKSDESNDEDENDDDSADDVRDKFGKEVFGVLKDLQKEIRNIVKKNDEIDLFHIVKPTFRFDLSNKPVKS